MIQLPLSAAVRRLESDHSEYSLKLGRKGSSFAVEIAVPGVVPAIGVSFHSLNHALFLARLQLRRNLQKRTLDNDLFNAAVTEAGFDRAVAELENEDSPGQFDDDGNWDDDDDWY